MDNIVDYLVIGFFIISFLSSLFKKKKVKSEQGKVEEKVPAKRPQPVKEKVKKANNPFEEFFKAINEELEVAKNTASKSEVDEYYEQAMENSESSSTEYIEPSQQFAPTSQSHEFLKKANESEIHIKSYSDSVQYSKEQHESRRAKELRRGLMNKNSIKEFIVMNEILGKPKALQR